MDRREHEFTTRKGSRPRAANWSHAVMRGSSDGLKYAGGKVEAAWSASFHVVNATPQQRIAE